MKNNKSKNNSLLLRADDLLHYEPMTINQEKAFQAWKDGDNLVLTGSAGTGKTFVAMYLQTGEIKQSRRIFLPFLFLARDHGKWLASNLL